MRCGRDAHTSRLTLLPMGFTQLPQSPATLVRSYRTLSPLPVLRRAIGGLLSVALACVSPRLAVSQHRSLWSPDLPQPRLPEAATTRPTHRTTSVGRRRPCAKQADADGSVTVATVTTALDDFGGFPAVLGALQANEDLTGEQTGAVLATILDGGATDAQIAAFVVAIRQKGETVDELAGMVRSMQDAATPLTMPEGTIDIVGMGGAPRRRKAALNVSTMACFVAAAAGATVCKHGNRKASSTSGSFDLLEALDVKFDISPAGLESVVTETNVGFAFARAYHPAMRHVGPVRAQLGIPTVFNALGPLSHPARLTRQVVGVADEALADRMIAVLAATGSEIAWVVTGDGPLDELSTTGPTTVRQLKNGEISTMTIDPASLGITNPASDALDGGDAQANAAIIHRLFGGETGPMRDIVLLNAAAGLVVAGLADNLADGMERGGEALDSGAAADTLAAHIAATNAAE